MTCDRAVILLATGGPLGRWRARRHCARCPGCAAEAARLRRIARELSAVEPLSAAQAPCGPRRAPTPGRRHPGRRESAGRSWPDGRRPSSWCSRRTSRGGGCGDPGRGRGRVRRSSSRTRRSPRAPASGRRRSASSAISRRSCGPSRGIWRSSAGVRSSSTSGGMPRCSRGAFARPLPPGTTWVRAQGSPGMRIRFPWARRIDASTPPRLARRAGRIGRMASARSIPHHHDAEESHANRDRSIDGDDSDRLGPAGRPRRRPGPGAPEGPPEGARG